MDERVGPPEERLARRLDARAGSGASVVATMLHELAEADRAVYQAIASTPSPSLDAPLRRLSNLADNSKLWVGIAGGLALVGGRRGRQAAVIGVVGLVANSALVNLPMKRASRRVRPDREAAGVPEARWVEMPTSTSFPSGHSASAFAFAGAVAGSLPFLAVPLRGLAAAVAYSRVHTGVHYPGDVVVGSLVGATIGEAAATAARVVLRRFDEVGRQSSSIGVA